MIDRRGFVSALTAAVLVAQGRAFPQNLEKMPRVGVLVSATPPHPFADSFRRGLQPLGYVEGENIAIEWRYTEGRSDRAAPFAAELVRLGVDVIVAHFTPAVRAAMVATQTIPIIMAPAGAPVQSGFIDSLAHPGGNVTGLSGMDAELGGKRLQLLRESSRTSPASRFSHRAYRPIRSADPSWTTCKQPPRSPAFGLFRS